MDFDVQRFTKRCAASDRELAPGETFYSVLTIEAGEVRRQDFAAEAWQGPPAGALACWKGRVPQAEGHKPRMAPNDVLRELFASLEGVPEQEDMRLVMALLLVRRRVLRLEKHETDEAGRDVLVLFCPRDDVTYRVTGVMPSTDRAQEIQNELSRLLYAGAP